MEQSCRAHNSVLLGARTQGVHLEPLHQYFFFRVCVCDGFFQDRGSWTICLGWLWTAVLLISASWVARIISVSYRLNLESTILYVTDKSLSTTGDWIAEETRFFFSPQFLIQLGRLLFLAGHFREKSNFKQFSGAKFWKFSFKGNYNSFWK
jgi:hypothetical protein